MYILGISCYYHDAAAAILQDGDLIAAASEERFSRKKHDSGFPKLAIDFCLEEAGITTNDLDYVVFYEKPLLKFERILLSTMGMYPQAINVFRESMIAWFNEKLWIKSHLLDKLKVPSEKLLFTEHHMSHAASAFFASPFEEAAVLTIDGVGEWTTATIGHAVGTFSGEGENRIDLFGEAKFPHSLGLLYSAFTAYLGFEVNEGEYKVMGMAPFGEARYLDKVYQTFDLSDDGSFRLNMDYFTFHHSATRTYGRKFVDLFGPERKKEMPFFTAKTNPEKAGNADTRENERFADIAASIQVATEEAVIKMAKHAHERTGSKRLVMAGGVALNSVANGRILDETPFDELYIQPEAGDSGGALGAALYAYHVLLGKPRKFIMETAYYGKSYSAGEIRAFLDKEGIPYEYIEDENVLLDRTVETMLNGGVVGWHQGRFEWGPRALGNRSILADPRRAEMKEIVNVKIKFREPFRPFAPVVTEECAGEFFDMGKYEGQHSPRFMLVVRPIPEDKQSLIPAVTHVNGGGRLQSVRREDNPWYYGLIERFGQATGVPVLLNTSFNLRGEPIVTTPQNAFNTFSKGSLELLVMDHFMISKDALKG
jgi:carbamoyltransferase